MDKGLIFTPDVMQGLECYVNVGFAGGWSSGNNKILNQFCLLLALLLCMLGARFIGAVSFKPK